MSLYGGTGQFTFNVGGPLFNDQVLLGIGIQGSVSYENGKYAALRTQNLCLIYYDNESLTPWSGSLGIDGEFTRYWADYTMRLCGPGIRSMPVPLF